MKMYFFGKTKESLSYSSITWKRLPDVEINWWNLNEQAPDDAVSRFYGVNGWVVMKYEHNNVFIIITDTGNEKGTAGPW